VLAILKGLAVESGVTMLVVTHEMAFAREVSDRLLFLEKGKLSSRARPP
jgi:ABC-type histidine transport system ATPase subunit